MAYPRSQRSRAWKRLVRTAGNVTIATTALNIDTALDITLLAQVGDGIEFSASGRCNTSSGSDATFDVATIVSAAVVNYVGAGMTVGQGVSGWYVPNLNVGGASQPVTGAAPIYTVVSGDLAAGIITLRIRAIGGGSGACALNATTTSPFYVWARNLGPVSPH